MNSLPTSKCPSCYETTWIITIKLAVHSMIRGVSFKAAEQILKDMEEISKVIHYFEQFLTCKIF